MDNFEAIMRMDRNALEAFLDQVYLTGVNTGMFAAGLPNDSDEQAELLDENPFNEKWLSSEAENATLGTCAGEEDEYILDALATAVFRSAGIQIPEEGEE